MSPKHIGACLAAGGLAAIGGAIAMNRNASFEDGTFIIMIVLGCAGALSIVAGVVIAIFV